ncbi:olfactory receptor 6M1-like [Anomaloglossus baeobatrachus]|uniref:olfactory receptor 6M1-like n=1 Tax=Anomaloglossus baeobatrachus TaxID=238106 RepID=UPI003F503405
MVNYTTVNEFIFVAFPSFFPLEISLFILFLVIYIVIDMGNLAIILLTFYDVHLHLPMYFFLANISFLEMNISTVVIPKVLSTLLSCKKSISFVGCFVQCYMYFALGTTDFILLAGMSYDRYIAICKPFQYVHIMNWRTCFSLSIASWIGGFLIVIVPAYIKASLPYCKENTINHFFCDSSPLMKLACADSALLHLFDSFMFTIVILGSFFITVWTYIIITITICRIPSVTGRRKTFSTCISHLFLVVLGYGGTIVIYVVPKGAYYLEINKLVSILTIFITPVLSPFIFSLRNESMQVSMMKTFSKIKKWPAE